MVLQHWQTQGDHRTHREPTACGGWDGPQPEKEGEDGRTYKYKDRQTDRQIDKKNGQTDEWMNGWRDEQMDRHRQTDRQTNRQTDRHMITPQLTKWLIKSGATKPSPAWLVYEEGKLPAVLFE